MRMTLTTALMMFAAAQAVAQSAPPQATTRPEQQQGRVPDTCQGVHCEDIGEPTGTGFGDRGIRRGATDPYDLGDSPVKGGPPITGPTGLPLNLPDERRTNER